MKKAIKAILCFLLNHKYRVYRKVSSDISELICERCENKFGICHSVKTVLPLDDELRRAHDEIIIQNL